MYDVYGNINGKRYLIASEPYLATAEKAIKEMKSQIAIAKNRNAEISIYSHEVPHDAGGRKAFLEELNK